MVRRSSSMMPTFMVFSGSDSSFSTRAEDLAGQRDFIGAVHLRLDDIDRARAAVLRLGPLPLRSWIASRPATAASSRPSGISSPLLVEHRVGEHVMADIAHQHQAAAMQRQLLAVGRLVDAVGIERALQRLAALLEIGRERAVHQAERVAIDQHLVVGVDGGDRVFHVENGRDRGFQDHVGDAGRIVLADGAGCGRS